MTNEPIYGLLDAAEEVIEIAITSDGSGATFPKARAYKNNTLGQLLDGYAKDIGVDPNSEKIIFINSRTNKSTSDKNMTVEEFGLFSGDVLKIEDDSGVAGYTEEDDDMDYENEEIIEISLKNQVSGATFPQARVYGNNTLGQLLEGYAKDIGIKIGEKRVIFTNKRTGKSTSDTKMSVDEFGLIDKDVLEVGDDSTVAGTTGREV